MPVPYDYRNCQSLFGYAQRVHERSGAICELCGCGAGESVDFDLWKQFTVEHLIGESQHGYPPAIRRVLTQRFPELDATEIASVVERIDDANTVSACALCNSQTSRTRHDYSMEELILNAVGGLDEVVSEVQAVLQRILKSKRDRVREKQAVIRDAFARLVEPGLLARRRQL